LHDLTVSLAINGVYGDNPFVFERTFDQGHVLGLAREDHTLYGMMTALFVAVVKNGREYGVGRNGAERGRPP
jgi:hypothetical protein